MSFNDLKGSFQLLETSRANILENIAHKRCLLSFDEYSLLSIMSSPLYFVARC